MGEDCSFLVAFAAAPRASRPASLSIMWLLPMVLALTLIALGTDGCLGDDVFGTSSVSGKEDGFVRSTTSATLGRINRDTAGIQGTVDTERRHGGSGAAISTGRHGGHRISIQPSASRLGSGELRFSRSDSGGGTRRMLRYSINHTDGGRGTRGRQRDNMQKIKWTALGP